MDPGTSYILSFAVFGFIFLALFLFAFVYNKFFANQNNAGGPGEHNNENRVARRQQGRRQRVNIDEDDETFGMMEDVDAAIGGGKKIGTKKLKKLEEKEARRQRNEEMKQEREERAQKQKEAEEERKEREAREAEEERLVKEEEKRKQEEREKAEYEEYLKLKEEFSIDQAGEDAIGEEEQQNLLQQFIDFVKTEKIVTIEDLAARFKLRVQDAIDRLHRLIDDGYLTGVIDERGKFVYVSVEELAAVADFIRQRGRVSFTELVNSSQLISVPQKKPSELAGCS